MRRWNPRRRGASRSWKPFAGWKFRTRDICCRPSPHRWALQNFRPMHATRKAFWRRRTTPCTLPSVPVAIGWSSAVASRRPSLDQPGIKDSTQRRNRVLASRFIHFRWSDQYQNFSDAAVGEVAAITAYAVSQWQKTPEPFAFPSQFSLEQRQKQQCVLAAILESRGQLLRVPKKEQGAALERETRHRPHMSRNQNGSGQHARSAIRTGIACDQDQPATHPIGRTVSGVSVHDDDAATHSLLVPG